MVKTGLKWEVFEPKFGKWARYIKPFFEEGGFDPIYKELKKYSLDGRIITPRSENTFRFLQAVNPDFLKVIIIGMDSYPKRYRNGEFQATGIAFDCSNSPDGKLQPSLTAMLEGIEKDVNYPIEKTPNLNYLCEQGVMLANRALTCNLDETGSHIGLWDPFWEFFLQDVIGAYFMGIPYLLLGKEAQVLKKYIFPIANPVIELSHPSSAARNNEPWETNGAFSSVTKLVNDNNGLTVLWSAKDWELPF